jgi:hypothetical protein
MSIEVTYYMRPNGAQKQIECTKIYPDDEAWFKARGVKLSMEDMPGMGFACYADGGFIGPDNELVEALEFSMSRSCEDTLQALRKQCEEMFANDSYGKPAHAEKQPVSDQPKEPT